MKLCGRNIGFNAFGASRIGERMSRIRHFRGHGVHSPFVYDLVRQVFMCSRPLGGDMRLHDALVGRHIPTKRAVQLQNLFTHCGCGSFAVDSADASADLVVLTADFANDMIADACASAERHGSTVAVMAPHGDSVRERLCREITARHRGTSVDNRAYLLIFNNNLPKQHFVL